MADGQYRFQQSGTGQYYYPHNQHNQHQRHLARNQSPGNSGRIKYNNDTPSPSRSPVSQSPAHHPFGMYNQGHQGQHVMNGQGHQRYGMQMSMPPKYQHQNHHPQHAQNHQHHHPHNHGHGGHGGSINHQHTYSSGNLSNPTPNFAPNQLHNGTPNNASESLDEPISEYWQQQLHLAEQARHADSPHYHARSVAQANKGVIQQSSNNGSKSDGAEDGRNRAMVQKERPRQDWMAIDFGAQGLKALAPTLFTYAFLDKLYLNNNRLRSLPSAIGKLKNLTHLDLSGNQLTYLPPEIGMLVNLKQLLLFDNELHDLPYDLGSLFQLDVLGIEGNPLDEGYMEKMKADGTKGLIQTLREDNPGPDPPRDRDWIVLDETATSSSGPPADKLTVLSYNILCAQYCTTALYGYSPTRALAWDVRKETILGQIKSYNADIVCLQEVDAESFNEYFRAALAYDNYKGVFWPKSRARTMADKEARLVDGCAIFYKHEKYILLDKQMIDFQHLAINRPDMKGEQDVFNRVMPRDNIAVVTFFENRATGSRVIAVNAHVHWDPALRDVKLVQVAILMEQVTNLAEKYSKFPPCTDKVAFRPSDPDAESDQEERPEPVEPGPSQEYPTGASIPLLICGDFNSDGESGVYDLLAHGALEKSHSDLQNRGYGSFTRDGMTHPFKLKSAYANIGELPFTNYTPGYTDVIDYIWYSTNALQVTGLLGEVDKEYLQRVPGFPNYHFPSDHLALLGEFLVRGKKGGKVVEADFGPQREKR